MLRREPRLRAACLVKPGPPGLLVASMRPGARVPGEIPVSECGELVQDEPSRNLGRPHAEARGAPAQFFDDIQRKTDGERRDEGRLWRSRLASLQRMCAPPKVVADATGRLPIWPCIDVFRSAWMPPPAQVCRLLPRRHASPSAVVRSAHDGQSTRGRTRAILRIPVNYTAQALLRAD